MKKVSFSASSKPQTPVKRPSSSAVAAPEQSREYITVFDSTKAPPAEPPRNRIISPKPNEWMPFNSSTFDRNLNLPTRFEEESSAAPSAEDSIADSITYGLNLRSNGDARVEQESSLRSDVDQSLIKLREDLKRLPEITGFDEFEDMPVEEFERALLAGYGWVQGMGIGRNAREDVKVVECRKWTANEGLGVIRNSQGE